jgi:hypothetical protein
MIIKGRIIKVTNPRRNIGNDEVQSLPSHRLQFGFLCIGYDQFRLGIEIPMTHHALFARRILA